MAGIGRSAIDQSLHKGPQSHYVERAVFEIDEQEICPGLRLLLSVLIAQFTKARVVKIFALFQRSMHRLIRFFDIPFFPP